MLNMSTNTLSENLKRLLFEGNIKAMDLARATNVPQPTIQRIVAGNCKRPHLASLEPIATYFNLSIGQLKGDDPIPQFQVDPTEQLEEIGIKRVPILGWDKVMEWLDPLHPLEPSTENTILTDSHVSKESFALEIKDSAMEPLFPITTTVIFDPNKTTNDRNYIAVKLSHYDEVIFRQLLIDAGDKFIKPLSPDLEQFRMHLLKESDIICGILVEAKLKY